MSIETITVTTPFLDISCALGEAPYVDETTGTLRFVDIIRREFHSVALSGDASTHRVTTLPDSIGVTAPIHSRPDTLIVAAKRGFALYTPSTGALTYLTQPYAPPLQERMRFNDGAVDSLGRFWAGSMNDFHVGAPRQEGTVFRLDPDLSVHRMIENVTIPNGIGWSPDDSKMYFTDSPIGGIDVFDFVRETGEIGNRRPFFRLPREEWGANVVLDGCAVDIAGNVWTAVHEGACVLKLSPEGTVLAKVELPAWRVTCPAFGKGGELFVTTAGVEEEGERPPEGTRYHGAVFRVMTGVQGATRNKFGPLERELEV